MQDSSDTWQSLSHSGVWFTQYVCCIRVIEQRSPTNGFLELPTDIYIITLGEKDPDYHRPVSFFNFIPVPTTNPSRPMDGGDQGGWKSANHRLALVHVSWTKRVGDKYPSWQIRFLISTAVMDPSRRPPLPRGWWRGSGCRLASRLPSWLATSLLPYSAVSWWKKIRTPRLWK